MVTIRRSNMDKVVTMNIDDNKVVEFKAETFVLASNLKVSDWNLVGKELNLVFGLPYTPNIIPISAHKGLAEIRASDQQRLVDAKEMFMPEIKISLLRWLPSMENFSINWFKPRTIWITLFGILYHVVTYKVVTAICENFGFVDKFANLGTTVDGPTRIKVKVKIKRCELWMLPQFLPFVDKWGVVCPVCLTMNEHEVPTGEVNARCFLNNTPRGRRSFADMVHCNLWVEHEENRCGSTGRIHQDSFNGAHESGGERQLHSKRWEELFQSPK